MKCEIYILAGGKSSRMKQEKGLVELNQKPMILHVIDACQSLNYPIHIVTNDHHYQHLPYPSIADHHKNIGPIGGLHAALEHCESEGVLLLSCDIPFIQPEVLTYLLNEINPSLNAIIPTHNNRIHPLIGWYNKSTQTIVNTQISSGNYRMTDLINQIDTQLIDCSDFPASYFKNINTPEDLPKS